MPEAFQWRYCLRNLHTLTGKGNEKLMFRVLSVQNLAALKRRPGVACVALLAARYGTGVPRSTIVLVSVP